MRSDPRRGEEAGASPQDGETRCTHSPLHPPVSRSVRIGGELETAPGSDDRSQTQKEGGGGAGEAERRKKGKKGKLCCFRSKRREHRESAASRAGAGRLRGRGPHDGTVAASVWVDVTAAAALKAGCWGQDAGGLGISHGGAGVFPQGGVGCWSRWPRDTEVTGRPGLSRSRWLIDGLGL